MGTGVRVESGKSLTMSDNSNFDTFLVELQKEAEEQAKLSRTRILPSQLDWLTSAIGNYPWQTVAMLSFATAVLVQLVKNL